MGFTVWAVIITAVLMILSIIFKPYVKVGKIQVGVYCIVSILGALVLLSFKALPVSQAIKGITANTAVNPLKILTLFISMTLISVYLGDAGFFSLVADRIFGSAKGSAKKLFILLYAVVSFLTVFTSNDIIILTFTPPICIFCKKAKISPIPFLFGEFVAANTWSMALIVGNPTNVYLAGSCGITFFEYVKVMILPAIAGGITGLVLLLIIFNRSLCKNIENKTCGIANSPDYTVKKVPMISAITALIVCIIALAVSDLLGVEMWLICFSLALALTLFNFIYQLITEKSVKGVWNVLKKAPYELIPFVLSMFIIVLSLKECGATDYLAEKLLKGSAIDGLNFGVLSALSANLLNNIPMSVLFEKIISGQSLPALYGAVIGSNVGAFITPVGALAGIMWNKILSSENVKLSFGKFVFFGVITAVPTLIVSTLSLMLVL